MLASMTQGPTDLSLGITTAGLIISVLAMVLTYLATSDRGAPDD